MKVRNSKAPGIDGLINKFLKYSPTLVLENLTKFFNLVLSTSKVPTDWTIGLIQPINKGKGSPKDVDSYRGITLLSSIGKLFTSILNARIMNYMEVTGFLGDEQAGFRKGHSTLDHIFVLHTVIDLYLREKKRVFALLLITKRPLTSLIDSIFGVSWLHMILMVEFYKLSMLFIEMLSRVLLTMV